jgi:hypothetical protein
MTEEEFQKKIKKANWFDLGSEYVVSCLIIVGSILIIYSFNKKWYHIQPMSQIALVDIFSALMFLSGIFAFRSIQKRYKIIAVSSSLSATKKIKLIEEIAAQYSKYTTQHTDDFYYFQYNKKWWLNTYDIRMTYNENYFLFSVQVKTGAKGGWIDIGQSEKLRNKILTSINLLLEEHNQNYYA